VILTGGELRTGGSGDLAIGSAFVDDGFAFACERPGRSPKTRALMPVHLYGLCAGMDPILAIAKKHNLLVIEVRLRASVRRTKVVRQRRWGRSVV
jgi:hypothetical protein